jgi:hypothetical protein
VHNKLLHADSDTVVAVFAKRKGSKKSTNLLAGEQGVEAVE